MMLCLLFFRFATAVGQSCLTLSADLSGAESVRLFVPFTVGEILIFGTFADCSRARSAGPNSREAIEANIAILLLTEHES